MSKFIPKAGEIIHLNFDPASGKEMKGNHYCLVLSPSTFNEHFELAWVIPITTGSQWKAKSTGTALRIDTNNIHGVALCHQIKSLDWMARRVTTAGMAPKNILGQALEVCGAVLHPDNR